MCVIAAFQQRLPPVGRLLHLQSLHVCLLALHVVGHNCICIQTAQLSHCMHVTAVQKKATIYNKARIFWWKQSQLLGTTYSVEGTLKVLLTHSSPQFYTPLETITSNLFLPPTSTSPLALISHLTPSPPDSSLLTPPHLYQTLTHHWDIISKDTNLKQLFSPPQLCFRQEKAVFNYLVSAKTLGRHPLPLQPTFHCR